MPPGDPNPWTLRLPTSNRCPAMACKGAPRSVSLGLQSTRLFPGLVMGKFAGAGGGSAVPAFLASSEAWPSPSITLFCLSKVLLQLLLLFLSLLGFSVALGISSKKRRIHRGLLQAWILGLMSYSL